MQIGPLLRVEPGERPTIVLPLEVECAVRGVSSDGRSGAEAGVIVTGEDQNGDPHRTVQGWRPDFRIGRTAEDGSLTLPRLPDEQLRLTVHAPGRGADERSGFEQGTVRLVAAAPPNTVSLRVVDSDGEPVPKVLVREGPELWPAGITDDEGIARIVPSGGASRRLLVIVMSRHSRRYMRYHSLRTCNRGKQQ
jgi:hypothetical protein